MSRFILLVFFCFVVPLPIYSETLPSELVTRNEKSISTPQGKEYEMKAIQAFWGDAGFMRKCSPSSGQIPEPLTILFEVRSDGHIGEYKISPDTKVGRCIAEHTRHRLLPLPPINFVVRIDLTFR